MRREDGKCYKWKRLLVAFFYFMFIIMSLSEILYSHRMSNIEYISKSIKCLYLVRKREGFIEFASAKVWTDPFPTVFFFFFIKSFNWLDVNDNLQKSVEVYHDTTFGLVKSNSIAELNLYWTFLPTVLYISGHDQRLETKLHSTEYITDLYFKKRLKFGLTGWSCNLCWASSPTEWSPTTPCSSIQSSGRRFSVV